MGRVHVYWPLLCYFRVLRLVELKHLLLVFWILGYHRDRGSSRHHADQRLFDHDSLRDVLLCIRLSWKLRRNGPSQTCKVILNSNHYFKYYFNRDNAWPLHDLF